MTSSQKPKTNHNNKQKIPLVALFGLPNSGKSTLLNRICGFKKAITANEAHTTRDLNWGEDIWENMYIRFVDTGGLIPKTEDKIIKEVQIKTWGALIEADLLVWVIDRRQDPESISLEILQRVWKLNKPFIVGINKVDTPSLEKDISEYAKLGGVDFVNFSAINAYGLSDLMDIIVKQLELLGFEKGNWEVDLPVDPLYKIPKKQRKIKTKIVKQNKDGSYYIVRENTQNGPGMYQSLQTKKIPDLKIRQIKKIQPLQAIVYDLDILIFRSQLAALESFLEKEMNEKLIENTSPLKEPTEHSENFLFSNSEFNKQINNFKNQLGNYLFNQNQFSKDLTEKQENRTNSKILEQEEFYKNFYEKLVKTFNLSNDYYKFIEFLENFSLDLFELQILQEFTQNYELFIATFNLAQTKEEFLQEQSLQQKTIQQLKNTKFYSKIYATFEQSEKLVDKMQENLNLQTEKLTIFTEVLTGELSNLVTKFQLNPEQTVFITNKVEIANLARKIGCWAIEVNFETNLTRQLKNIEEGKLERIPQPPKILFLGKPNVGKSSLFNALVGKEIQIVTDIAGTTLSVNEILVERIDKQD